MLDGDLFDKLAEIGSAIRKLKEPFGGIQVWKLVQLSSHSSYIQ